MQENNPKLNASGCNDPVAYKVLKKMSKEELEHDKKATDFIKMLKMFIRFNGYEPMNRIAIRDNETGKEYR